MPRRSRFPRRKYGGRRKFGARRFVRRTARVVKRVLKRFAETKFNVQNVAEDIELAGPHIARWHTGLFQGTTGITRIGNKIQVKRISFRMLITMSPLDTNTVKYVRVSVLWPKKNTNGEAAWEATAQSTGMVQYFNPTDTMVLYDRTLPLAVPRPDTGNGSVPSAYVLRWSKKWNQVLHYIVSDQSDKYPILLIQTSSQVVNLLNVSASLRMSFIDI